MPPLNRSESGCLVHGKVIGVGGGQVLKWLSVTPEKAVVYEGVVYTAAPQSIAIADDGNWKLRLPPGRYRFEFGDLIFMAVVPFGVSAVEFIEIIDQSSA